MSDDLFKTAILEMGVSEKSLTNGLVQLVNRQDARQILTDKHIQETHDGIQEIKTNIAVFDERLSTTIKRVDKIDDTVITRDNFDEKLDSSIRNKKDFWTNMRSGKSKSSTSIAPPKKSEFTWGFVAKILAILTPIGLLILGAYLGVK